METTIILIAVVLLVGGLGYYVFQRRKASGAGSRGATGTIRRPR